MENALQIMIGILQDIRIIISILDPICQMELKIILFAKECYKSPFRSRIYVLSSISCNICFHSLMLLLYRKGNYQIEKNTLSKDFTFGLTTSSNVNV